MTTAPLRLGISRCLLGEEVRYDGSHNRDNFLTEVLSRYVEWIPVCPEVEAGLGTPREAMRLVGDPQNPRLVTIESRIDHTHALKTMAGNRIEELKKLDVSGYVFKKAHRAAVSGEFVSTMSMGYLAGRESGCSRRPL